MIEVKITYDENNIVELLLEEYTEDIIEKNVPHNLISKFYLDELNINTHVKAVNKSLYVIYTGLTGYDTYDSGVFCAYTEKQAVELATKLSGMFNSTDIVKIGLATEELPLGEVCASFNAG